MFHAYQKVYQNDVVLSVSVCTCLSSSPIARTMFVINALNWGQVLKFQVPAFLPLGAITTTTYTISQGDSHTLQHYNATEATADAVM